MTHIKPVQLSTTTFVKISYDRKQIRARLLKRDGLSRRARPLPLCRRKNKSKTAPRSGTRLNPKTASRINTPQCEISLEPIKGGKQIGKKSSIVKFNRKVSVVHIKSHRDYPKYALRLMYSTRKEIKDNATRNKLEFYAEGSDWRNVLEEDAMLIDENGEYFHPVHSMGLESFLKERDALR